MPCPTVSPTSCDVIPLYEGDANCDYEVNEEDVIGVIGDVGLRRHTECRYLANVKCDDALTLIDALFILQYTAGITAQIPAWCPPIGARIPFSFNY